MFCTRLGLTRLGNYFEKKSIAMFPEETRNQMFAKGSTTKFIRTALQEWNNLQKSCDQLKQAVGFLGDKPLTVLSAGKIDLSTTHLTQEQIDRCVIATEELQRDLVTKSNQGKQIIVPDSDHLIPSQAPGRIIDAIREQVQQINQL